MQRLYTFLNFFLRKGFLIILLAGCPGISCIRRQAVPPAPYGAVPSPAQLRWHEMEYYGFIHFGLILLWYIEIIITINISLSLNMTFL